MCWEFQTQRPRRSRAVTGSSPSPDSQIVDRRPKMTTEASGLDHDAEVDEVARIAPDARQQPIEHLRFQKHHAEASGSEARFSQSPYQKKAPDASFHRLPRHGSEHSWNAGTNEL